MSEILINGKNCRTSIRQSMLNNNINVIIPSGRMPMENNANGIK
jgi:hypothetical protein